MMPDRTKQPLIRPMTHFEIARPEKMVMGNGMPLNVIRVGDEDVVRFDLLVRGGMWTQEFPLQAMFTNRMLREGTVSLTSVEIAEKLDFYGAWLDLSSSVNYGFITLYSLGKYFPETIGILASIIKEPVFPEKELAVVVEANKQQFKINAERVDVMARKAVNRALFGEEHPLGRYAELQDYENIRCDMLSEYYQNHYHSANCSAYVSGKVTPEVIKCIETHFGSESWGKTERNLVMSDYGITSDGRKRIFLEKEGALQSSLKMAGFTLERSHPDYLKLRILVTLFGGYFGSRLMSNIREDKGYTYGIGAGVVSYPGLSVLGISTEAANEYVEFIVGEVYGEMDRLCNEKPSEDELEMVRNYMLGDLCRSYENAFSLSDAWIFTETSGLSDDFFERSLEAIRETTAEDIRNLAQQYFCKENIIEVVAGKKM